jgi:secreted trypsin-like serine protease
VFGENDISGDKEPRRPVSRNVRRVIVHRGYDAATFEHDLAVLELESPVKFDAHIGQYYIESSSDHHQTINFPTAGAQAKIDKPKLLRY